MCEMFFLIKHSQSLTSKFTLSSSATFIGILPPPIFSQWNSMKPIYTSLINLCIVALCDQHHPFALKDAICKIWPEFYFKTYKK